MVIVDSQVHIWKADSPDRPWRAGARPHRDVPFSADDLLLEMDAAGVTGAILVPPILENNRNDLALAAAQRHPDRFAVMGRIDTEAPEARTLIASWRRQPGMLGLRFNFNDPDGFRVLAGRRLDWLWAAAEKACVPIMLMLNPTELQFADRIAAEHPELRLVLDHLALPPDTKVPAAFAELDKLLALARRPNVAAKASAMPAYASDGYPYRSLYPYLRRVYDAFGPRRMFWGSDFSRLKCSYRQAITMFTEDISWFTAEDKEWIMGRGLCEWLGWKLP